MPWYAATLILGRDVLLSFVGIYVRWKSLPPPKTFKRLADLSIPTHTVHPNLLGKVNTALQMFYIGGLVLLPWIDEVTQMHETTSLAFEYFGYLVSVTTFCSGVSYLVGRNAAKLLRWLEEQHQTLKALLLKTRRTSRSSFARLYHNAWSQWDSIVRIVTNLMNWRFLGLHDGRSIKLTLKSWTLHTWFSLNRML